ncbi:hypothetical protein GCM10022403_064580 [Streptomyces coacervatus]|uniref:Transposase n=1 Tax=Streptomyces coacervatus TaxID=647381 RepID=A0ABP7IMU4_9ACTN
MPPWERCAQVARGPGWFTSASRSEEGVMNRQIRVRVSRRPATPRDTTIDRRTPSGRILPY